jgi:cytochrome b561
VRGLLWLERNGITVIGIGVLVTGLMLLGILGSAFANQPWLLAGIAIYAGVLVVSFFIQRPGLRKLLRISRDASPEEQQRWRDRARRQRYVSYGMAGAVGIIGWLMMAKPGA